MSVKPVRVALLGLLFLPALAVAAAADMPGDFGGRFTMSPVEGGFLRLDKQTGSVAMCAKAGSEWACKPIDDQTTTNTSHELSRLAAENRELRGRVKELEELLETHPGPPPPDGPLAGGPHDDKSQLPTDEEVDEALDYMSRVYKKIRDHIKDLKDYDKTAPQEGQAAPPGPPSTSPPSEAPPPAKGAL